MAKDPDYYELHRQKYIEGLKKAKVIFDLKDDIKERKASEEREAANAVAKILLDRHKAKVSKIVVERPYLQKEVQEEPQVANINQIQYTDESF